MVCSSDGQDISLAHLRSSRFGSDMDIKDRYLSCRCMWEALLVGWKALLLYDTDNDSCYSQPFTPINLLKLYEKNQ